MCPYFLRMLRPRASAEKFPGQATETIPKNSKKKSKNSTIKPHSTISVPCVPCMKIQGGTAPPPASNAHGCVLFLIFCIYLYILFLRKNKKFFQDFSVFVK